MSNPSDHWLENLILLIQECGAENGMGFGPFLEATFGGLSLDEPDHVLVQTIREKFDMEGRRRAAFSDVWPKPKST